AQRDPLTYAPDPPPGPLALRGHVQPQNVGLAAARREQAAQNPDEGGFARAVGAEQPVDHPAVNLQIHSIERRELAEFSGQLLGADGHFAAHLGTRMKAAMPARRSSSPERTPIRAAKTWSARSSAVWRFLGENSPTLLMCSTTPLNVFPGKESTEIGTSWPTRRCPITVSGT